MPKIKSGEKITWSDWFKMWGNGIKQVATNPTPLEKLNIEIRATFINLIGVTTCLTALIIFREQFFVSWFAYGLILIFVSTLITTTLKFFGLREQKKFIKNLNQGEIEETKIPEEIIEDKENKEIDSEETDKVEDYLKETEEPKNIEEQFKALDKEVE